MATKAKKQNNEPKVVKGSHLTVTTYPDGRTELEWDDEALMRDVREALASVEVKPAKKKAASKAKKVEEPKVVEKPKTKRKTKEKK